MPRAGVRARTRHLTSPPPYLEVTGCWLIDPLFQPTNLPLTEDLDWAVLDKLAREGDRKGIVPYGLPRPVPLTMPAETALDYIRFKLCFRYPNLETQVRVLSLQFLTDADQQRYTEWWLAQSWNHA